MTVIVVVRSVLDHSGFDSRYGAGALTLKRVPYSEA
jgi:hypothetical protein